MADAEDAHDVLRKRKQYAVVADAQAEGTGHAPVQRLDVAAPGAGVVKTPSKMRRRWGGPGGERRPWLRRTTRPGRAALLVDREVFRIHSKLGQHVLHGNAIAAALSEPSLPFVKAAAVFFAYRFWSVRFVVVVDHDFERVNGHGFVHIILSPRDDARAAVRQRRRISGRNE